VLHDTEGSSTEYGRLVMGFDESVKIFKLGLSMLSVQLEGPSDKSDLHQLQQQVSDVLCSMPPPQQMIAQGLSAQGVRLSVARSLLSVCSPSFCNNLSSLLSGYGASFCCGNPSCLNLTGASELDLLMGGAAGNGGGYCSGCKMVCYCSDACQKDCWEDHRDACTKYQQEADTAGGQTAQ
jgi:hypothetical protein